MVKAHAQLRPRHRANRCARCAPHAVAALTPAQRGSVEASPPATASQRRSAAALAAASQRRSVAASQRRSVARLTAASRRRPSCRSVAASERCSVAPPAAASERRSVAASPLLPQRRSVAASQRRPPPEASERRSVGCPTGPLSPCTGFSYKLADFLMALWMVLKEAKGNNLFFGSPTISKAS